MVMGRAMNRNSKGLRPAALPFASTREARRDSLFLLTAMSTADGQEPCKIRVRNLSAKGLMADCPVTVEKGQQVLLDLRGIGEVTGSVVWTCGERIGIGFTRPVDPAKARMPVQRAGHAIPDYLRPLRKVR